MSSIKQTAVIETVKVARSSAQPQLRKLAGNWMAWTSGRVVACLIIVYLS